MGKLRFMVDRLSSLLGMQRDSGFGFFKSGEYYWGKNISHVTQQGSTGNEVQNVLGTVAAFTLPVVAAQQQITRFYFTVNASVSETITYNISDWNGVALMAPVVFATTANNATTTLANFITAIGTALTTGGQTFTFTAPVITGLSGYVDLTITGTTANVIVGRSWSTALAYTAPATATNYYAAIRQEALDVSVAGDQTEIGSYDLLGDLFVYSSSQNNMPANILNPNNVPNPIASITNNGAGLIRITLTNPVTNPILTGEAIQITGITSTGVINGFWIVNVISSTVIDLLGSTFTAPTSFTSAIITQYIFGYGTIAVSTFDRNTEAWTYLPLLRSKELNFRVQKMIDVHAERNVFETNNYFTDDFNPVRVFYYKGPYVTDGAITALNGGGLYAYGTIFSETTLLLNTTNFIFSYNQQLQNGGAVMAGNHRYAIRLLTENLAATLWTDLSDMVNVFDASTNGSPALVFGDDAGFITPKINEFLVSGIIPGLFKYIELADVYYSGSSVIGSIVRRDLLTQNPTQIIQHTGFETDVQDLDLGTLLTTNAGINTAKNINAIDNRLIISNITTQATIDFQPFVDAIRYNLKMDTIPSVGVRSTGLTVNEYQQPSNTFNKMGFMINETYRIGCKVKLKSGGTFTDVFHYSDVKFDMAGTSPDGKRLSGLPFMDLTDSGATLVNIPYFEPVINWNININGVSVADLVESIEWMMVEMAPNFQEVLGSGVIVMGSKYTTTNENLAAIDPPTYNINVVVDGFFGVNLNENNFVNNYGFGINTTTVYFASPSGLKKIDMGNGAYVYNYVNPPVQDYVDFYFACGSDYSFRPLFYPGAQDILYSDNANLATLGIAPVKDYGSFYGFDEILNLNSYTAGSSDQLIVFGAPNRALVQSVGGRGGFREIDRPNYTLFSGWTNTAANGTLTYGINEAINISRGSRNTFPISGQSYSKQPKKFIVDTKDGTGVVLDIFFLDYDLPSSPVLKLSSGVSSITPFADLGVYICQIFRPKPTKFGAVGTSKYIPTGTITTHLQTVSKVYGDVFTQQKQLKHIRTSNMLLDSGFGLGSSGAAYGLAGQEQGLLYYSQNRVNSSMINKGSGSDSAKYPVIAESDWLNVNGIVGNTSRTGSDNFLDYKNVNTGFVQNYNQGYNSKNSISSDVGFDVNLTRTSDLPTRIYYSDLKPIDSVSDKYRNILPLNFHDNDLSFGEIIHHANVNGELFTWQMRKFQRQYFNTRGQLSTKTDLGIIIGDGTVLSRDGVTISVIGATHKWGIVRGKSTGGNDVFCWINTELKKCVRFEQMADGSVTISDVEGMQSFFANNLMWVAGYDNPASGQGIAGVYDDRNFKFIWTMRAHRVVPVYNASIPYNLFDEVYDPAGTSTYEKTGDIYISLISTNTDPLTNTLSWQRVPHQDEIPFAVPLANGRYPHDYWNEYTIAHDSQRKRFTTEFTPKPKTYLKWTDTYLSPDPADGKNIYQHNKGVWCRFYNGQNEDGYLVYCYGVSSEVVKRFKAMELSSLITPQRIDAWTKLHQTFMLSTDFENINGTYAVAFTQDILSSATGSNVDDTDRMTGDYILIKVTFQQGVQQSIIDGVIKFSPAGRNYIN